MRTKSIFKIESFVRRSLDCPKVPVFLIGHDFKHFDRVRKWALRIAAREQFDRYPLVEAVSLLHDIGLAQVDNRSRHAELGADVAAEFLRSESLFPESEILEIFDAIRCHSSLSGGRKLGEILRDADILDLLGAVGILRAFTSKSDRPDYLPGSVKGETWGNSVDDFSKRFATGEGIGPTIIDQINFQMSCCDNLRTKSGCQIGKPLVEYMRAFVQRLEAEVDNPAPITS